MTANEGQIKEGRNLRRRRILIRMACAIGFETRMEPRELGIREARAQLGYLADAAALDGTVTIITRNGRPFAAIMPLAMVVPDPIAAVPEARS
jgi:prevent-host-death family protein